MPAPSSDGFARPLRYPRIAAQRRNNGFDHQCKHSLRATNVQNASGIDVEPPCLRHGNTKTQASSSNRPCADAPAYAGRMPFSTVTPPTPGNPKPAPRSEVVEAKKAYQPAVATFAAGPATRGRSYTFEHHHVTHFVFSRIQKEGAPYMVTPVDRNMRQSGGWKIRDDAQTLSRGLLATGSAAQTTLAATMRRV